MGTKLDQKWAQGIRENVNALIFEIERLEAVNESLEVELMKACKYLREGKERFAPGTTNSFVDEFLEKHEQNSVAKMDDELIEIAKDENR